MKLLIKQLKHDVSIDQSTINVTNNSISERHQKYIENPKWREKLQNQGKQILKKSSRYKSSLQFYCESTYLDVELIAEFS